LFIPNETPAAADQETVQFTWLRAVDAAMRGSADQGLRASCSFWQRNDASMFWKFIFKQPLMEQRTRALCRMQGWLDQPSATEGLFSDLVERLLKAIGDDSPQDPPTRGGALPGGDEFHDLIPRIQHASDRVDQEGIGLVSESVRVGLSAAATRLAAVLQTSGDDHKAS
jgi:hypothetical protein